MSDPFSAVIGGIGSAIGGIINYKNQKESNALTKQSISLQQQISNQNFSLAKDAQSWQKDVDNRNFDYMTQMNQTQMAREDTAHQRQVNDLKLAGLSPLANLQGSTTGSTVSQAAGVSPVVPQQDGSGIASAMATAIQNKQAMAGLQQDMLKTLIQTDTQKELQEKQQNHEKIMQDAQINADFDRVQAQIDATAAEGDKERAHSMQQQLNQFQENREQRNHAMDVLYSQQSHEEKIKAIQPLIDEGYQLKRRPSGMSEIEMKRLNDEAFNAIDKWTLNNFANSVKTSSSSGSSNSESNSNQFGGGASVDLNLPLPSNTNKKGNILNKLIPIDSASLNMAGQHSEGSSNSESFSKSRDATLGWQEQLKQQKHKYTIYY